LEDPAPGAIAEARVV